MTAGRKPKPTHLKLLQGNPGKRALNQREPRPRAAIPPCPRHLSKEARREWRRVSRELLALGLLTHVDRAVLAMYCQAWGKWVMAEEKLAELGAQWTFETERGYVGVSPWVSIANAAAAEVRRLAVEFGMTPSSRSRTTATQEEEADPYEEFLRGRKGKAAQG